MNTDTLGRRDSSADEAAHATPPETLKRRYAEGETSTEKYEERKRTPK